MKKYLFVVMLIFGFLKPAWGGQTYTNSDLRKYDKYKSKTNTNSYRSTTKYEQYPTRQSAPAVSSYSANKKRDNGQILSAKEDLRNVEKQIKNLERKIQFHSKMKDARDVVPTCRAELKKLHKRSESIQNNINDLKLLQAGAEPAQVMSNRQAARNAERYKEEKEKRDFSDGIDDGMIGLPPKSYDGPYYDGYLSQITSSRLSGENDARMGLPPKSQGGPYYNGYLSGSQNR